MKKQTAFIRHIFLPYSMALFFCASLVLFSCNASESVDLSDPLAAGRGFIEASLKSDYVTAEKYMLEDSTNKQYLDGLRDFSTKLTPLERENYRDANIIIDSTQSPNDSTDFIYYRNSYKMEPTKLKLIRNGKEWRVDFKETFH